MKPTSSGNSTGLSTCRRIVSRTARSRCMAGGPAVGEPAPGANTGSGGMEQSQPAAGPRAVLGEQIRVVGPAGFFHEEPAEGRVRFVNESVVAERRDREAGKDVLVDRALDLSDRCPTPLRYHGRSGLAHALEPVHIALPLTDPQRRDRRRLGLRIQLAPGAT